MRPLFISATGTNVGKTYATIRILEALRKLGFSPLALKPIETGASPTPHDACAILETMDRLGILNELKEGFLSDTEESSSKITYNSICFEHFLLPASPFVSALSEAREIDIKRIISQILAMKSRVNPLIIEGAGGLLVPILRDFFMIDLAKEVGAHTLLVLPARLGSINEALLSIEALKSRALPYTLALNLREEEADEFAKISEPFWRESGEEILFLERDLDRITEILLSKLNI